MLSQAEADQFMLMSKRFVDPPSTISIPPGADDTYELAGLADRDKFQLDVWRGTLRLSKLKYQNRIRTTIVLVRLDVDGAPHTNPDGVLLPGTHLHLFKEGYDDRWAYSVNPSMFTLLSDPGN